MSEQACVSSFMKMPSTLQGPLMVERRDRLPAGSGENGACTIIRRSIISSSATHGIGAAMSSAISISLGQAQTGSGTERTLIHRILSLSRAFSGHKALWEVAQRAEGASFKNLEMMHSENLRGFDRVAERKAYAAIDRLILMFPIRWFNLTPMLAAYLNEIWGAGPPGELQGKEMLVVTTTGGDANAYSRQGRLGFTIEEVLTPLRASAKYASMSFSEPSVFFGATGEPTALRHYQDALTTRLRVGARKL